MAACHLGAGQQMKQKVKMLLLGFDQLLRGRTNVVTVSSAETKVLLRGVLYHLTDQLTGDQADSLNTYLNSNAAATLFSHSLILERLMPEV